MHLVIHFRANLIITPSRHAITDAEACMPVRSQREVERCKKRCPQFSGITVSYSTTYSSCIRLAGPSLPVVADVSQGQLLSLYLACRKAREVSMSIYCRTHACPRALFGTIDIPVSRNSFGAHPRVIPPWAAIVLRIHATNQPPCFAPFSQRTVGGGGRGGHRIVQRHWMCKTTNSSP